MTNKLDPDIQRSRIKFTWMMQKVLNCYLLVLALEGTGVEVENILGIPLEELREDIELLIDDFSIIVAQPRYFDWHANDKRRVPLVGPPTGDES